MFDFRKVNDYMQIFENDYSLRFFVLPFFHKKHKIKNKVGIKTTFFFINNGKYMKQKPYTSSLSSRAGRKDFFGKSNNKHIK